MEDAVRCRGRPMTGVSQRQGLAAQEGEAEARQRDAARVTGSLVTFGRRPQSALVTDVALARSPRSPRGAGLSASG